MLGGQQAKLGISTLAMMKMKINQFKKHDVFESQITRKHGHIINTVNQHSIIDLHNNQQNTAVFSIH